MQYSLYCLLFLLEAIAGTHFLSLKLNEHSATKEVSFIQHVQPGLCKFSVAGCHVT
jgi:hypothetical protein